MAASSAADPVDEEVCLEMLWSCVGFRQLGKEAAAKLKKAVTGAIPSDRDEVLSFIRHNCGPFSKKSTMIDLLHKKANKIKNNKDEWVKFANSIKRVSMCMDTLTNRHFAGGMPITAEPVTYSEKMEAYETARQWCQMKQNIMQGNDSASDEGASDGHSSCDEEYWSIENWSVEK